ncbi:MerR family transcriptional regulator [Mycobacterium canetti]|uniref:MerR family transcriptional regulator n=1 Tax=Mycobacterium canetti TaxID=78331 RepID=UPI0002A555E8|nr:MerR family transcriptional regulator [Mycobacterium canetti]CCK58074.1 Transcriptional regulator, MerR family [Mycobacterium canettii CIPT 140070010]
MGKVKHAHQDRRPAVAMTIGRAAAAAGLSRKTVRLYETRGLLLAPARSAAGYRLYTEADVARLRFIAAARQLGLHVGQVAEILDAAPDGQRPCATTNQLLDRRIGEIDQAIAELSALRDTLTAARDTPAGTATDAAICPVLENPQLHKAPPTPQPPPSRRGATSRARSQSHARATSS